MNLLNPTPRSTPSGPLHPQTRAHVRTDRRKLDSAMATDVNWDQLRDAFRLEMIDGDDAGSVAARRAVEMIPGEVPLRELCFRVAGYSGRDRASLLGENVIEVPSPHVSHCEMMTLTGSFLPTPGRRRTSPSGHRESCGRPWRRRGRPSRCRGSDES
jgi:hypothetical protein